MGEMGWDSDILDSKLAITLDDSAEVGTVPTYEDAVQAFRDREKSEAAKAVAAAKSDSKGKKGKAGAEEEEDLDALLAEAGMEVKEGPSAKKKGKKGKAEAKKDDDDDFLDGLTAQEAPAEQDAKPAEVEDAKTIANRKKKEKKKGNKAGGDDGADGADDFDAALDEFKADVPAETATAEQVEVEPAAAEGAAA